MQSQIEMNKKRWDKFKTKIESKAIWIDTQNISLRVLKKKEKKKI